MRAVHSYTWRKTMSKQHTTCGSHWSTPNLVRYISFGLLPCSNSLRVTQPFPIGTISMQLISNNPLRGTLPQKLSANGRMPMARAHDTSSKILTSQTQNTHIQAHNSHLDDPIRQNIKDRLLEPFRRNLSQWIWIRTDATCAALWKWNQRCYLYTVQRLVVVVNMRECQNSSSHGDCILNDSWTQHGRTNTPMVFHILSGWPSFTVPDCQQRKTCRNSAAFTPLNMRERREGRRPPPQNTALRSCHTHDSTGGQASLATIIVKAFAMTSPALLLHNG